MYVLKMGGPLRGVLKPLHKRAGATIMVMAFATICIGLLDKESSLTDDDAKKTSHAIAALVFVAIIGFIFSITKYVNKKESDPEYAPINLHAPGDPTQDTKRSVSGPSFSAFIALLLLFFCLPRTA